MVNEVATVGVVDVTLYLFDKPPLALQHVGHALFHHLRGLPAFPGGELLKLSFGIGLK
jgi:hypothetical protein